MNPKIAEHLLMYKEGFAFAVARHSHRSRNRRSKQAKPVLAPVQAVAKREGYILDSYTNMEITIFKFVHCVLLHLIHNRIRIFKF